MIYFIKFIVNFMLPPGLFIVLPFIFSLFLRTSSAAFFLMYLSLFLLYLCSTPFFAYIAIKQLEQKYTQPSVIQGDVLVMLGGGATQETPDMDGSGNLSGSGANRLITTARLYFQTGLPIILTSGKVFRDDGPQSQIAKRQLIQLGVPSEKIITEDRSKNTHQNAQFTAPILKLMNFKNPVLITSAFHMQRSVIEFSKAGFEVVPYPTDYKVSRKLQLYLSLFVPKAHSLSLTEIALHK